MNDVTNDRVGPMLNPPHLGELIRESMDDVGWNVTETAARFGCERGTLSRLLNGKAGVSANMALTLEDIGWGTADHWMRMQASYDLAQARRSRAAAETARGRAARMIRPRASAAGRGTVSRAAVHPHPANGRLSGARCGPLRLSWNENRTAAARPR